MPLTTTKTSLSLTKFLRELAAWIVFALLPSGPTKQGNWSAASHLYKSIIDAGGVGFWDHFRCARALLYSGESSC
jgi:hypothetical protein